jgi:hypothetical protein
MALIRKGYQSDRGIEGVAVEGNRASGIVHGIEMSGNEDVMRRFCEEREDDWI